VSRYPGNHVDSGIVTVPRNLKTRPGAPETHLAYITPDEERLLQKYKPGTPHRGPEEIPNYDSWSWDSSGTQTGGSTADTNTGNDNYSYNNNNNNDYNYNWETSSNPWGNDYEEPYTPPKPKPKPDPPQPKPDPPQGEHKFATRLNELIAAGKGNTTQANLLKNYLYGVKTNDNTSNAYFDWYNTLQPQQLDVSSYDYGDYDLSPGAMGTGFGSVFGSSSGVPGQSSVAVTDTLKFMMEDYINQGFHPNHAAEMAFDKFYVGNNVDYVNFMGDKNLPTSEQPAVKALIEGYTNNNNNNNNNYNYNYNYNYGRGRGYGIGRGSSQREIDSYNPEFGRWGQSTVQGDFIRSLKNRGGIISIVR